MSKYFKKVREKISKLTYEQLQDFITEVHEENEVFDSILESLSTGLIIVDRSWKIIFNNKAGERYLPFSMRLDDSRSDNVALYNLINDEQISKFLKSSCDNGCVNVSDEFTTVTRGGSIRFITISILPLVKTKEISGYIVSVRDITEMRNKEILLRRMENLAGLTNLAAGMAHEIKNPLGAISIHVQLIQKALKISRDNGGVLPSNNLIENHIDIVNEEIDNLNKKVMDFLMAVRPINAKLELVDIEKVVKETASFIAPEFQNCKITLNINLCQKYIRLLIDEKLFRDALLNIAQNALFAIQEKYSECSANENCTKCSGLFEIESNATDDKYILTISDNGIGMDDETSTHIFEPYFTTKAKGTGLGMTMVYKIIKEFSGDIQVKSKKGEGSTFTIMIPVPQMEQKLLTANNVN